MNGTAKQVHIALQVVGKSAAMAAVLALVTAAWPDWIEIVTGSAPDGGSGALERAVVAGLAAAAILLAAVARAEWRRATFALHSGRAVGGKLAASRARGGCRHGDLWASS